MKESETLTSESKRDLTFEEAMQQLEETVRKLESGELPLTDSIAAYKQAMTLVQFCRKQLDEAEFQIQQLVERDDVVTGEPLPGVGP
ncbi:MAG: exodeoxyribonuclease VII small subunit [Alicyclobacillus sp.]|nr:exodeoxyribonuclease VII small subunit [Alicyclobacillus sp.]